MAILGIYLRFLGYTPFMTSHGMATMISNADRRETLGNFESVQELLPCRLGEEGPGVFR